jgi:hypothetical protein
LLQAHVLQQLKWMGVNSGSTLMAATDHQRPARAGHVRKHSWEHGMIQPGKIVAACGGASCLAVKQVSKLGSAVASKTSDILNI